MKRQWATLAIVALATFMTTLDASIVNISLPSIARAFHRPIGGAVEWVIIAYLAVIAASLLTFGRLSDLVGRKRVWMAGLAVFTLGSICCGAAGSLPQLVGARLFQGLGAALILAPSFAIIADAFPPSARGRAFGLNSVVFAVGTSLGPTLGGLITEHLTWRWIFYVNVPLGVLGLLASHRVLDSAGPRACGSLDVRGAASAAAGFALLTLSLSLGQQWGWTSPRLVTCLALAVATLVAAVLIERQVPHPVVDLALLRERVFASALGSLTLSMLALFGVSFMLPFYFEELRGFSVERSAVMLTPLPLTIAVVAPLSGTLADRLGSRWLAAGGLALASLGLVLLARLDETSTTGEIVVRLVLTGIGQGLFQSPNTRALMNAAPSGAAGEASGLLNTARTIGQSLSVALAGTVFTGLGGAAAGRALIGAGTRIATVADIDTLQRRFLGGFEGALMVSAAIAAMGILAVLVRGDERRRRPARVPAPVRHP